MNLLKVSNLEFGYGDFKVLKDLSFNIQKGKFVSIIGPNGSGKSTLLKTLNNIYKPDGGSIELLGKNINDYKKKDLAKEIALVPQNTNIDYDFLVEDIVMMGRHPHKGRLEREDESDYAIVKEAMELTNTYKLKGRSVTKISGGERQRVMIAKAIAQNPNTIFLDEPTSSLDINHQIDILNLLRKMNKEKGSTIVLVIHDINMAARYSDEIILLYNGKILDKGEPKEVINKLNMEEAYNIEAAIEINKYTNTTYLTPLEIISD